MHCLRVANNYELRSRVSITGALRLLRGDVLLADTNLAKTPEPDLGLGFKAHKHIHTYSHPLYAHHIYVCTLYGILLCTLFVPSEWTPQSDFEPRQKKPLNLNSLN